MIKVCEFCTGIFNTDEVWSKKHCHNIKYLRDGGTEHMYSYNDRS